MSPLSLKPFPLRKGDRWRRVAGLLALGLFAAPSFGEATARLTEKKLDALLRMNPRTGKPVDSIEELVHLLPEELRRNFTFVYDSRSPFRESITALFPRVILFSEDGKFVATFTGDPGKKGYNILETLVFDEKRSAFMPRVRLLPAAKRSGESAISSHICARCHGKDTRPIFDSYPLWPGFYGSIHDTFPPEIPSARQEQVNYLQFLKLQARSGVYKDLLYIQGSSVSPFLDPKRFRLESQEADASLLFYQPNERLGIALTGLNRRRIFRKLSASPNFRARERELLRELLGCGPSALRPEAVRKITANATEENTIRLRRLGLDPLARANPLTEMQELKYPENLAQLDWLASASGVTRADWSMALEENSLSYFDGVLAGMSEGHSFYFKEDFIFEILRHLAAKDARFRPYFKPYDVFVSPRFKFGRGLDLKAAVAACGLLGPGYR